MKTMKKKKHPLYQEIVELLETIASSTLDDTKKQSLAERIYQKLTKENIDSLSNAEVMNLIVKILQVDNASLVKDYLEYCKIRYSSSNEKEFSQYEPKETLKSDLSERKKRLYL